MRHRYQLIAIAAFVVAALFAAACKESPSGPKAPRDWNVAMNAKNTTSGGAVSGAPVVIQANSGDVSPGTTNELGQTNIVVVYQNDEPIQFGVSVPTFKDPNTGTLYKKFSDPVKVARVWFPREGVYVYLGDIPLVPLQ